MLISGFTSIKFGEKYDFDIINIENHSVIWDDYKDYFIKYDYNDLIFEEDDENYSFKLSKNEEPNIIEVKEYYVLAYVDYTNSKNPFLNYVYINKDELSNDNSFMENIKNRMKKYLLSERSELLIVNDRENDISYLGTYNIDYGYYLLTGEYKMSILNRD